MLRDVRQLFDILILFSLNHKVPRKRMSIPFTGCKGLSTGRVSVDFSSYKDTVTRVIQMDPPSHF